MGFRFGDGLESYDTLVVLKLITLGGFTVSIKTVVFDAVRVVLGCVGPSDRLFRIRDVFRGAILGVIVAFTFGVALEFRMSPPALWQLVHRSNRSELGGRTI